MPTRKFRRASHIFVILAVTIVAPTALAWHGPTANPSIWAYPQTRKPNKIPMTRMPAAQPKGSVTDPLSSLFLG
jgi:hypothetical protein